MTITDDPVFDWDRHCAEEQEIIESAPICECCSEPILDDHYYSIDGEIFCEECIMEVVNEKFKYFIED